MSSLSNIERAISEAKDAEKYREEATPKDRSDLRTAARNEKYFLAVSKVGMAVSKTPVIDSKGITTGHEEVAHEYAEGYLINPAFADEQGRPPLMRVRLKSAEETSQILSGTKSISVDESKKESTNKKSAKFTSVLTNQKNRIRNRATLSKLGEATQVTPDGNSLVIELDYVEINQRNTLSVGSGKEQEQAEYIEATANYARIAARKPKDPNDDRQSSIRKGYGRLVYKQASENKEASVAVEMYSHPENTKFDAAGSSLYKVQTLMNLRKCVNALTNEQEAQSAAFKSTGRKAGFIMLNVNLDQVSNSDEERYNERGERLFGLTDKEKLEVKQTPLVLYAERGVINVAEIKTEGAEAVFGPLSAKKTLTNLMNGNDFDTVNYLKNKTSPGLEEKAKQADMKRIYAHMILGVPQQNIDGTIEGVEPKVFVDNDQSHFNKTSAMLQSIYEGTLSITTTHGERLEMLPDAKRSLLAAIQPEMQRQGIALGSYTEAANTSYNTNLPIMQLVQSKTVTNASGEQIKVNDDCLHQIVIGVTTITDPKATKTVGSEMIYSVNMANPTNNAFKRISRNDLPLLSKQQDLRSSALKMEIGSGLVTQDANAKQRTVKPSAILKQWQEQNPLAPVGDKDGAFQIYKNSSEQKNANTKQAEQENHAIEESYGSTIDIDAIFAEHSLSDIASKEEAEYKKSLRSLRSQSDKLAKKAENLEKAILNKGNNSDVELDTQSQKKTTKAKNKVIRTATKDDVATEEAKNTAKATAKKKKPG